VDSRIESGKKSRKHAAVSRAVPKPKSAQPDSRPVPPLPEALPPPLSTWRSFEPDRTLLIIRNPGRMSRNWLTALGSAAGALKIRSAFIEIDRVRQALQNDSSATINELNNLIVQSKVGAVLNYAVNGAVDFPADRQWPGAYRNFFEVRGIPQLFCWVDHPQWVGEKQALLPGLQPAFRSGNQLHMVKSAAHAYELTRILGWPNCHEMLGAADPDVLKPANGIEPEFDVVAIFGSDGLKLPDWLLPFLEQDDPSEHEINQVVAGHVRGELRALWEIEAPPEMRAQLTAWTERAIQLKQADPALALIRHIAALAEEFPGPTWWLTAMYPTYFKAANILCNFRNWQRHFYLAYLSKYFRVGLFGGKWSHVGSATDRAGSDGADTGQAGTGQWVDYEQIPTALARGKVALNIVGGWDEEGMTVKTFELAACGTPMIHNNCVGLAEAFEPGREVMVFNSPRQARQAVEHLLASDSARRQMGQAARGRLLRNHTWSDRLLRMFQLARLPVEAFR
jgi:glycosyl transferase family 1